MDPSERMRRLTEPVESMAQNIARRVIELEVEIAGTAVVYTWEARAARLRFLSRDSTSAPAGS
jgi:hypothetical protein